MQIKTTGIVLKQRNIGENDKIITILTEQLGIIEASAKNAKSTKSVISGSVQILSYNSFCLFKGKSGYIINSADSINTFYNIRLDVVKLSLAGYFCELLITLCGVNDDNKKQYLRLILNSLHYLQLDKHDDLLIKAIFQLRIISIAGFMPNLVCCRECAVYESDIMYFMPISGSILCGDCISKFGHDEIRYELNHDNLSALRYIIFSDLERLFKFSLSKKPLEYLEKITENYTMLHTEARFNSLEMYKNLACVM